MREQLGDREEWLYAVPGGKWPASTGGRSRQTLASGEFIARLRVDGGLLALRVGHSWLPANEVRRER